MLDTARVNSATVRQLQINQDPLPEGKETHPKVNQVGNFKTLKLNICDYNLKH